MRRHSLGITLALLIGFAGIACYFLTAKAAPSQLTFQTSSIATTSVSYMDVNATSTYAFNSPSFASGKLANMQQIDNVAVYFQAAASSTSSIFVITPQFSNNGIDWYNLATATSTVTIAGASPLTNSTSYQWTANTTATTSLVFNLPPVPANYERVQFSMLGAAGAVYSEYVFKRLPSNP